MVKAKVSNQVTKVTAGSYNKETSVTSTNNPSQYWANVAEAWAKKMDGMVANEDYSAKYYATKAKEEHDFVSQNVAIVENIAETSIENINTIRTEAVRDIESAVSSIDSQISAGVEELNHTTTEGIESIETTTVASLTNITNTVSDSLYNINTTITEGVETIETLQANSIAEITTNKETALSDIDINKTNTLAQISTLANTSISDINAVGKSYDNLTYRNITNCLLEVPQRIKYDLTDGTLTVKAGTVVIVPYGTEDKTSELPVGATFINDNFKVYDTQYTEDADGNGKFFVWAELVGDLIGGFDVQEANARRQIFVSVYQNSVGSVIRHISGDNPTTTTKTWTQAYNTSTNLMGRTNNDTVFNYELIDSLPIIHAVSGAVSDGTIKAYASITQVFNGMGYIGSTFWIDKGVKGLIPNGRNEDGTLNNIEIVTNEIAMSTSTSTQDYTIRLSSNGKLSQRQTRYNLTVKTLNELYALDASVAYHVYVVDENRNYYTSNSQWNVTTDVRIITATLTNGVVSNFNPKQPFRAVDYNDKPEISGWGMPSDKYINLTLGASGSSYTAPATGWVVISKKTNSTNQSVSLGRANSVRYNAYNPNNGGNVELSLPVQKGQSFYCTYSAGGALNFFRFIYAEGEV